MAVIVLTGASSGIGEAVALQLAARKHQLVLAARNPTMLERVAAECRELGAEAICVPTDVGKEVAVTKLARAALDRFGRIDAWINNAGVIAYGRFTDIKPKEFQRVIQTNLFGTVYGSRMALQQFCVQEGGTLINISSGFGAIPAPFASPYVAGKFAVRGFTASLYQEFDLEQYQHIRICSVLPATIDTPVYRHAGNRTERMVQALPPTYSAAYAARKIVRLLDKPKPEMVVGAPIRIFAILYAHFPRLSLKLFARYVDRLGFRDVPAKAQAGNLFKPAAESSISGGWQKVPKSREGLRNRKHKEAV